MKLSTTRFGDVEVSQSDAVTLVDGLIGFPELTRYVLLDHDKDSPFKWLQSVDDATMAFVIINPLTFRPDYSVDLAQAELNSLMLKTVDQALVSVIVTIPMDPKKMSANLKAPLLFNMNNRTGKQVIVKDPKYQTKHFIIEEIRFHSQNNSEGHPAVMDSVFR